MITENGYSKEPTIMPEGIFVTFGKDMMDSKGGSETFMNYFETVMRDEEVTWLHKLKFAPKFDINYVYLIVANKLYARGYYGGFQKGITTVNVPGAANSFSKMERIAWSRIVIAGPLEKCPFERELKGFQGFRYCTKLF